MDRVPAAALLLCVCVLIAGCQAVGTSATEQPPTDTPQNEAASVDNETTQAPTSAEAPTRSMAPTPTPTSTPTPTPTPTLTPTSTPTPTPTPTPEPSLSYFNYSVNPTEVSGNQKRYVEKATTSLNRTFSGSRVKAVESSPDADVHVNYQVTISTCGGETLDEGETYYWCWNTSSDTVHISSRFENESVKQLTFRGMASAAGLSDRSSLDGYREIGTPEPKPEYRHLNPTTVTVGFTDGVGTEYPDREYNRLLKSSIDFWTVNKTIETAGHAANFTLAAEDETPDVSISLVNEISSCGYEVTISGFAGCADLGGKGEMEDLTMRIERGQTNLQLKNTLKHELGHSLGIEHGESPKWLMSHDDNNGYVKNAGDRVNPWNHSRDIRVSVQQSMAEYNETKDGVKKAIDYYNSRSDLLPAGKQLDYVNESYRADIMFTDERPGTIVRVDPDPSSRGFTSGLDYDSDDEFEQWTEADVYMNQPEELNKEYHAGYWLGIYLGIDATNLPEQYSD